MAGHGAAAQKPPGPRAQAAADKTAQRLTDTHAQLAADRLADHAADGGQDCRTDHPASHLQAEGAKRAQPPGSKGGRGAEGQGDGRTDDDHAKRDIDHPVRHFALDLQILHRLGADKDIVEIGFDRAVAFGFVAVAHRRIEIDEDAVAAGGEELGSMILASH